MHRVIATMFLPDVWKVLNLNVKNKPLQLYAQKYFSQIGWGCPKPMSVVGTSLVHWHLHCSTENWRQAAVFWKGATLRLQVSRLTLKVSAHAWWYQDAFDITAVVRIRGSSKSLFSNYRLWGSAWGVCLSFQTQVVRVDVVLVIAALHSSVERWMNGRGDSGEKERADWRRRGKYGEGEEEKAETSEVIHFVPCAAIWLPSGDTNDRATFGKSVTLTSSPFLWRHCCPAVPVSLDHQFELWLLCLLPGGDVRKSSRGCTNRFWTIHIKIQRTTSFRLLLVVLIFTSITCSAPTPRRSGMCIVAAKYSFLSDGAVG